MKTISNRSVNMSFAGTNVSIICLVYSLSFVLIFHCYWYFQHVYPGHGKGCETFILLFFFQYMSFWKKKKPDSVSFSVIYLPILSLSLSLSLSPQSFPMRLSIQRCRLLTLSQTSPGFYTSAVQVFENTVGKGEIARYEQFLLFPQCFLPV